MITINQKKQELFEKRKFDIGAPLGPEQRDHRQGDPAITFQVFEKATIYIHPDKGPVEVHGTILKKYNELGGHGVHPKTGKREFGIPLFDEGNSIERYATVSYFEHGAIFTGYAAGPIPIYGKLYDYWAGIYNSNTGIDSYIGYPLCEPFDLPNGEKGVFFENAFLFTIDGQKDVVHFSYQGPLLGDPHITSNEALLIGGAYIVKVPTPKWQRIEPILDAVLKTASQYLVLESVKSGGTIPAKLEIRNVIDGGEGPQTKKIRLNITAGKMPVKLLFNLAVLNNYPRAGVIGLHAVYTRDKWENFGVIHATDLHVSYVNDYMYSNIKSSKFGEIAEKSFENYNDNFRDFIHYANKLHDSGAIDLILLTGDLIDYQFFSNDEARNNPFGNFLFFENMIKGNDFSPKTLKQTEELRVPLVTTLGNHDYRKLAYLIDFVTSKVSTENPIFSGIDFLVNNTIGKAFDFSIDTSAEFDEAIETALEVSDLTYDDNYYASYNLLKSEKEGVYINKDGKHFGFMRISATRALYMLVISEPRYYKVRINRNESNATLVRLGSNVIYNINTGHDKDAPTSGSSFDDLRQILETAAKKKIPGISNESEQNMFNGSPDVDGILQTHIDSLKEILNDPSNTGSVIVTMHAPPINTKGNEYGPFLRETDYKLWKKEDILFYLMGRVFIQSGIPMVLKDDNRKQFFELAEKKAKQEHPTWIESIDKPYFKTGTIQDNLDFGISSGLTDQLLNLCTGKGVNRPVDLVLSGHGHRNLEYRLGTSGNNIEYYMDFYTENPTDGYNTKLYNANNGASIVKVQVNTNLIPSYVPEPSEAHKQVGHKRITFYQIMTRPYNDPLNSSKNSKEWWSKHRPLITQTAALGPLEGCQRDDIDNADRIQETVFQGFRVIRVRNNVIDKVHYVRLKELRALNYEMPWEKEYKNITGHGTSSFGLQ